MVLQSILQEQIGTDVRCHTCERRCLVRTGSRGWCRTRENRGGTLVSLIYGAVSSIAANPIEKKPFYHFHPGSQALTAGSWSCNFGCPWCQNWDITEVADPGDGDHISPQRFVDMAQEMNCQGTSISFNEPTLSLEWSLDVFRIARERGYYNTYVTNGYMTQEALSLLAESGLDAMNVDMKGDPDSVREYCQGIDVEKVWDKCRLARSRGMHLEITTLLIPSVNDSENTLRSIAGRIATELGREVPWHVSGYAPAYRFTAPPTPVQALEKACQIGREAGLDFVYIGNAPGHRYENTFCPGCRLPLVRRLGFGVLANVIRAGSCPGCGKKVPGVWE